MTSDRVVRSYRPLAEVQLHASRRYREASDALQTNATRGR